MLRMDDASQSSHVASRMAHIEAFEVMEIQTLARQVEAEGRDVIHLEIGEPDFRTPQPIVEAAQRALGGKPMFYTSALGLAELRAAIARFYRDRYRVDVDVSRIVVTSLTEEVFFNALSELKRYRPARQDFFSWLRGIALMSLSARGLKVRPDRHEPRPDSGYQSAGRPAPNRLVAMSCQSRRAARSLATSSNRSRVVAK